MTIRKRRRERSRSRAQAQHLADANVLEQCKREFNFAANTFNGTVCPNCKKPVPPRALYTLTGYYSAVHLLGCGVKQEYCHSDRSRCVAEARAHWGKFYSFIREDQ